MSLKSFEGLESKAIEEVHKSAKSRFQARVVPSGAEDAQADQWSLQYWVLEQGQGNIYVAVVNAGQQTPDDKLVKVEISLSKLQTLQKSPRNKQMTGIKYTVQDLWNSKDLSSVAFEGKIESTLELHDTVLLKFSPVTHPN
ncbi:hypothetical protein PGT21_034973 [Puccinia graminis f. sp. tritici]|uniref:Alpha galactosidase C-terminal domain-containing protein n=1 Tax=Puccinia graminis f. sp. tritici TaxID=56615 RepID=A0A5B0MGT8_PUCGR|nr:hypothetical protein PGT21_034973 [Puccinia graminis f. sp. tritici]KAA1125327.1 hypothetical protein PGTUg99_005223 [Puccinia graminis f. sp. tritici]